nr:hypothetical protein [Natrinema ejinorense]
MSSRRWRLTDKLSRWNRLLFTLRGDPSDAVFVRAVDESDGTAVFATNLRVRLEEAESFCRRYSRRWHIENEYESIKNDFLAKTSSKDYRVRLFYFGAVVQHLAAH